MSDQHCDDRWILCEDGMPEEHDSIFAKFKGTPKWNEHMFEKTSHSVIVTVKAGNGSVTTVACTVDGKWRCDLVEIYADAKIIAWMPLPEPYQPEKRGR